MYSKLLKPSRTDGSYVYMPCCNDNPFELVKLHQYEMLLPTNTIHAFRAAAIAVAVAVHVKKSLYEASHPYAAIEHKEQELTYSDSPSSLSLTHEHHSPEMDTSRRTSIWKAGIGSMSHAFDKLAHLKGDGEHSEDNM